MKTAEISQYTSADFYLNKCGINGETELHSHRFYEIAYVTSGSGRHFAENREYAVSEGDIIFINPCIPHKFIAKSTGMTVINCIFTDRYINKKYDGAIFEIFDTLRKKYKCVCVRAYGGDKLEVCRIFEKMWEEYFSHRKFYAEIISGYISELLVNILRLNDDTDTGNNEMQKICEYIRRSCSKTITVSELAKMSSRSYTDFRRKLREYTGMNISEYLQTVRMEEACRELVTTDSKISCIAQNVGYNDIKYFYEVFRRFTGKTPGEFRKTAE